MGEIRYTPDPTVNAQVSQVIEMLKQELITHFHPKSIVLAGSLGRGEATVTRRNQELEFWSDAEVMIIPNWHIFTQGKLKKFCEHFYLRTGLKVSVSGVIGGFKLLLPFLARNVKPTINNYDLKYGSKVIYGRDYLKRIGDLQPENIPVWEGIRLLFNRMAEALECFSSEAKPLMAYRLDKIVLACQDSLLLLVHRYHPSYEQRNKVFTPLFPKYFSDLKEKVPNLPELTEEATRRKLNGTMTIKEPTELWFDTAEVCDKVFRYVIEKEMGIAAKDYLDFQERYMEHPKLKEYIRLPFGNPICQNLWSALRQLSISNTLPSLRLACRLNTRWAHLIYSAIPLTYFGLLREKEIVEEYLNRALDIISIFEGKRIRYDSSLEGWEYARNQVVDYWNRTCW